MESTDAFALGKLFANNLSVSDRGLQLSSRQRRISPLLIANAMRATDVVVLSLALTMLCTLQVGSGGHPTIGPIVVAGFCAIAVTSGCLNRGGAYRVEQRSSHAPQGSLLIAAVLVGTIVFGVCLYLLNMLKAHEVALGTWGAVTFVSLAAARGVWGPLIRTWRTGGAFQQHVAVVGDRELSKIFIEQATADPGLRVVGIYNDDDARDEVLSGPTHMQSLGKVEDLVIRSRRERIDAIVLAVPLSDPSRVDRLRSSIRTVTADVYSVSDMIRLGVHAGNVCALGPIPMVRVRRRPLTEWQQFQKVVFDRLLGAVLLIVLLPTLLLIAVAIRLESPGPVLFRQTRIGFNNRNFTIFKFRTMFHHIDHESLSGARQARRDDPRITRVGKWLRKLSLDELPQLLNVLKGQMSLVGPRPHPPETRADGRLFQDVVEDYAMRHRVQPGITGWAQVSGWRGETLTTRQIEQRVAHDLYYIDNWSLLFDVRIIFLTIVREIKSRTAF